MNAISNIANDAKFQELILPEYDSNILTPRSESGISVHCTYRRTRSFSSPGSYGTQLSHQVMSVQHTQKNTTLGKSVSNRCHFKNKTTPRQQLQHLEQQANNVHPVSTSSTRPTSNSQNSSTISSGNQKLVAFESQTTSAQSTAQVHLLPSRSSAPPNSLSLNHPLGSSQSLYPVLQLNSCTEHQKPNHQAFCMFEGLTPSSLPSKVAVPYVLTATQTNSSTSKPYYTQSNLHSVSNANKPQQTHEYQCLQHLSGGRFSLTPPLRLKQQVIFQTAAPQSQLSIFKPPPRERMNNEFSQSHNSSEVSKIATQGESNKYSENSTRYHKSENVTSSELQSQIINDSQNMQSPKNLHPRFGSNSADTIATIQSTWLSAQPLGNVHLVMGLAAANALKKSESIQSPLGKEVYPNPIARPTAATSSLPDLGPFTSEENTSQTHHLHSDSSTSFDFSIEAEKMVSALCNSSTIKDVEVSDHRNSIENNERTNSERKQTVANINHEFHGSKLLQYEENDEKTNFAAIINNKDWILVNKASSDDELSITTVSTVDYQNPQEAINSISLVENQNTNINDLHLRLSPSSNSSSCTAKNTDSRNVNICFQEEMSFRDAKDSQQSKGITKPDIKLINVSCQTNTLQGIHDEQLQFRKTTVKGCHEINKIIEEYMSPSLEGLSQFCVEVQQVVSEPESFLVSESVLKDLIIGFLRLANCWSNLYPVFESNSKINNIHIISAEVANIYQNWTCTSQKLMEEIIKIFEQQIIVSEDNKHVPEETQTPCNGNNFVNQDYIGHSDYSFELAQSYPTCYPSTSLSETYRETPIVLTNIPQTVVTDYPISTPLDRMSQPFHSTPNQNSYANQNHKSNWRIRRFSDTPSEIVHSHNQSTMYKGKTSFQSPKDNGKRWNFPSTGPFNSSYDNPTFSDNTYGNPRKSDHNATSSSRASQSDSHVSHERFNRQHIGNRYKQKNTTSGKKVSASLNLETQLRDKALETLDSFTKQWQHQQCEVLKVNQKLLDHKLYTGKMSGDQINSIPKNKMIPLSQIETNSTSQSTSQSVDLSSWFQSFASSLPATVEDSHLDNLTKSSDVLYTDRLNHPVAIVDSTIITSQDTSTQSSSKSAFQTARRHSYQDSRNHITSAKGKTWSNKRNNSYSKISPSCNTNMMVLNDEHDSSDDPQERTYMKPGSYDVPKRKSSEVINRNITPIIITSNNNLSSTVLSPTSVGVVVPFPAAPIVPPPTRNMEMNPKILRHIQTPKPQSPTISQSNENSISSDLMWKKACQSARSLLETLQNSPSDSPTSPHQIDLEAEIRKIVEGDYTSNAVEDAVNNSDKPDNNEKKEREIPENITSARRKSSAVKTDHWLMRTLNNMSKLQSDNGAQDSVKTKDEQQCTTAGTFSTNVNNSSSVTDGYSISEIQKDSDIVGSSNIQKSITSKITVRRKEGKKDEDHSQKNKKSFNATSLRKTHQEFGKNNADSRKRKLQERSPNEEQTTQTKNDNMTNSPAENTNSEKVQNDLNTNTCNNAATPNIATSKPKNDVRNRATWTVWYSSRKRRGLSIIAVNKLEDILNVIWNMDASDFVKYPIASSDVNDYYKCVKHPMFLETIGYKLKNRIYETIEQFVHDFRRIFINAKLYNKDNTLLLGLTNVLETKFNSLLEDHFSGWEFGHITGDPNETMSIPALRYLAYTEKNTSSKNRRAKASKPVNTTNSPRQSTPIANPSSN